MQYIVLDMEWNQAWPGSYAAKQTEALGIRGEIVQIGAVRILQDQTVADEFQILIRPKFYKKMNQKISKLTGIKDSMLKEQGVAFDDAMARFRAWCGEDCVFLIWGFDDITMLKENLSAHGMDAAWLDRWYNAQMIFNAQTDGSSSQKALSTAMELMGIEPTRPAHDALGDAYHTALICSRLRLADGIAQYSQAMISHENGFHGMQIPGCLARRVFHGFADKKAALEKMAEEENLCPECEKRMRAKAWKSQPGRRYMTMSRCKEHGDFLIRVRLIGEPDGTFRANRLTYAPDSEPAKAYLALEQTAKRSCRRKLSARKRTTRSN